MSGIGALGSRPRVVVLGGGAAGTLTAVHLIRELDGGEAEIVLLDRDGQFGPGLAYGTDDPLHLLNVAAVRMGGISGDPADFHGWLTRTGREAAPEEFLPRRVYGHYLRELLDDAEAGAGSGVRLVRLRAEAVSLAEPSELGGLLEVTLAGGERIEADLAVLGIGTLAGRDPVPVPDELRAAGVYVPDPWAPGALEVPRGDRSVLVIGTGLTMVDVALSLGRDPRGPALRAISRHGLVPRRHRRDLTRIEQPPSLESGGLEAAVAAFVERVGQAGAQGRDWRDVLDSMRASTPELWRSLPAAEKRRFLAHLQRLWDVHRFRMAPAVADRFEELRETGRLRIDSCSVVAIEAGETGARVSLRAVGHERPEEIEVDRVINCTGAGSDVTRRGPQLVASLLAAGIARPDELRLGLDVDREGRLIDSAGEASERIYVVGGLRKGVEWEATGVTEIRDQAGAVARSWAASDARLVRR